LLVECRVQRFGRIDAPVLQGKTRLAELLHPRNGITR
jgi:hypothetical protein